MKKILLFAICIATCLPIFAQTDYTKVSTNTQTLKNKYGTPVKESHNGQHYDCTDALVFEHFDIYVNQFHSNGTEKRVIDSFGTDSDEFCFLSDIYPGGIKVGTRLSDLMKFNFINSKYGKGLGDNGIRPLSSSEIYKVFKKAGTHILFEKNFRFYYFRVENGVIVEWATACKDDATQNSTVSSGSSVSVN